MVPGSGRQERVDALRAVLAEQGLAAVCLRRPWNFAWFTGGADNRVDHSSGVGEAEIVVTTGAEYVLTSNIEAPRFRQEQTPDSEVIDYDWFAGAGAVLDDLCAGGPRGSDVPSSGEADVAGEVDPLRYRLDQAAVARYRQVGADAGAAVATAAEALDGDLTETEAAALVTAECRRRGLFTPVVLVAGAGRVSLHRHPVPSGQTLGGRALIGVCGERHGLYANLSRLVEFDTPDPETARRLSACAAVLDRMREATHPGRSLGEIFDDCRRFYAEVGFADEWRLHHQGGLTGYRPREVVARPETAVIVEAGQAFAWNPSIAGAKAEETFVLGQDGPEILAGG